MPNKIRIKELKSKLYRRQNGQCIICRKHMKRKFDSKCANSATFEHVIPRSKLPKMNYHCAPNLALSCHSCNTNRKDNDLSEESWEFLKEINHPMAVLGVEILDFYAIEKRKAIRKGMGMISSVIFNGCGILGIPPKNS